MRRHSLAALLGAALVMSLAAPASAGARPLDLGFAMPRLGGVFKTIAPTADVLRTAIAWRNVQPGCGAIKTGRFDWRQTDRNMQRGLRRGVARVVTLRGPPRCAAVRNTPSFEPKPKYVDAFGRFAKRVVERYGPRGIVFRKQSFRGRCCPVTGIEVWSEPSLVKKWSRPNGAAYGRFLKKVAGHIRSARNWRSRRMDVISAGMSAKKRPGFVHQLYSVPRIKRVIDVVGIHSYSPSPRAAVRGVRKARKIMRRHRHRAPIAITEHGWSTCPRPGLDDSGKCVPRAAQARYLKGYVKALRARKNRRLNVESFMWFGPQDSATRASAASCPGSPKHFYGFFDHAGRAKPSWFTWQALTGVNARDRTARHGRVDRCK